MSYNRLNIVVGWITWAIATYVFISTIEPTASFWDCGEFIATAYKLEVGHPPGAPFFMMMGRMFSMFSGPENAAMMINVMSALCSSFTILFLFWTVTHLAKKLISPVEVPTGGNLIAILGSGMVGGLAYTFSDSFWFSAAEGEVYGMSSLFTALVFWAMLRWEAVANKPYANRWIILIAFLMGLSIGVHLLNLLAIPAMTFIYYFKKHEVNRKGLITAGIVSVFILLMIQYGIIPGMVKMMTGFELLFVNSFGLPYNSGILVYFVLLISMIVMGLAFTHDGSKKNLFYGFGGAFVLLILIGLGVGGSSILIIILMLALIVGALIYIFRTDNRPLLQMILLCFTVILIGYSSFGLIMIRSSADTPMDENNPENVFALLSYLNREQYGDRPLGYGHFFDSPLDAQEPYKDGSPVYYQHKEKGTYEVADERKQAIPNYASEFSSVFPRMYSSDSKHKAQYKSWTNFKGKPKQYKTRSGEIKTINKPTMFENLTFFFKYQVGWMYGRYFMWNFAGRQNDRQGHGGNMKGNWLSGIEILDSARLGPQESMPASLRDNGALNHFYFLPLILGLIGLLFQFNRTRKDGLVVFLLFFFTGMAVVIYLNQYPIQPRERDYAYAASFYAFSIWIGLGVLALFEAIRKKINPALSAMLVSALCLAAVPGIMAKEGWDDHDRSDCYTARDFAMNYLDSCEPYAILFTNGDNDTFPLWYVQEVEGYRTDVRVVNLSLLNTDWYIDQMRRAAYDSPPVPFGLTQDQYRQGTRDYVPVIDKNEKGIYVDVKQVMQFITDDNQKAMFGGNKRLNYFPTKKFSMGVDKEKVIANGTVPKELTDQIVDRLEWTINKGYILKNNMMILDLLANNNWERPIYFAITTGSSSYIGLQDYFQLEGLAYRLVPFKMKPSDGQIGYINTDIMYNNLMNKFRWGGMEKGDIYLNENNRRMCMNLRNNFARLADAFLRRGGEGDKEKAIEVLDRCLEVMPAEVVPYNFFMLPVAEGYLKAGGKKKALELSKILIDMYIEQAHYFTDLDADKYAKVSKDVQQAMSVLYRLKALIGQAFPEDELNKQLEESFKVLQGKFEAKEKEKQLLSG